MFENYQNKSAGGSHRRTSANYIPADEQIGVKSNPECIPEGSLRIWYKQLLNWCKIDKQ